MDRDMNKTQTASSPFALNNIRMFIAFRVFFNARFYYPVFTILFLDFGLTISQFAILNAVWAGAIVLMEVPSGALADIWGRRNMLIFSSLLMIAELLLLCIVPLGHPTLLFAIFLVNRVLSGTAEAAASGADEAIAFDSLKEVGLDGQWSKVLAMQMRMRAIGRIFAMAIGAAIYDPVFMQRLMGWFGWQVSLTQDVTIRFPIYLTLIMALLTLYSTLRMTDSDPTLLNDECSALETCGLTIREILMKTLGAGKWILQTPFAMIIIAAGLLFDSIIRMAGTLGSQYYRLIEIPEAMFGIIGSGMALIGIIIPRISMKMVEQHTPRFNLLMVSTTTIVGFYGMTFFKPLYGLIPVVILYSGSYTIGFFVSHYLNHITESHQRATVLSFKGLFMNLSYGMIGLLYAFLIAMLRPGILEKQPDLAPQLLENLVFIQSFQWFPWTFVFGLILFLAFAKYKLGPSTNKVGGPIL
ncbi:MAG: MFS transporter [Deltaproteobacteria bacterium]|nr:MAG: MFS transporter [Deltaproteobacteria bacterium]